MSIYDYQSNIHDFLKQHKAFALSTQDADGEVYCAPLYYVEQGFLKLIFVSDPKSRHCENLEQDPHVAGTVYREGESLSEICGLQLMGLAKKVHQQEQQYRAWYMEKFPELDSVAQMQERFMQSSLYEFEVTWLRWIFMQDGRPERIDGLLGG